MVKDYIMNGNERYKALWKAVIVINDAKEKDYIMTVVRYKALWYVLQNNYTYR